MADHAAAAASGLRARAAVSRTRTAEVIVQHLGVGNAAAAQGHWCSHRRAPCDSIARDYEGKTICR
jgi:hypothetical protein